MSFGCRAVLTKTGCPQLPPNDQQPSGRWIRAWRPSPLRPRSFNTGPPASRALLRRVGCADGFATLDTDDPALTGAGARETGGEQAPEEPTLILSGLDQEVTLSRRRDGGPNQLILWPRHELTEVFAPTGILGPVVRMPVDLRRRAAVRAINGPLGAVKQGQWRGGE
jgi:hypothetical protein